MPANDGTPRVWYSIFYPEADGITIEHRALTYDHLSAAAKMRRAGLPEEYAAALGSGLWASADVLPVQEQRMGGVALEEGRVFWQSKLLESAQDREPDCRQLWPSVAAQHEALPPPQQSSVVSRSLSMR